MIAEKAEDRMKPMITAIGTVVHVRIGVQGRASA